MPSAKLRPRDSAATKNLAEATAGTVSDDVLRQFIGYNIKRAHIAMREDLASALAAFELRATTFSALMLIVDHPGMTQSQLAAALGTERSGMVQLLDELEARDLIVRDPVPNNRRSYALKATPTGVRLNGQAQKKARDSETRLLGHLSDRQKTQLIDLLQSVERGGSAPAPKSGNKSS